MGGFCIIILVIGWMPVQRFHAFFLLSSTIIVFVVVGLLYGMTFETSEQRYGLYNVLSSIAISIVATYFLDRARKTSYKKSVLIYQTSEELKKATKLKGELLQMAAHDLKDPLQVIIGFTDLLQTKLQDDRFAIEKLSKIYKSTDQMIKLITGLLVSASIESGKLELNKVEVDVGEMANDVVKSYRSASEKKNQQIIFEAKKNCMLKADKTRLRQIMENLLGNAIKFSPLGKSIWVSVDRRDSLIIFKVRDQGPGFTEEDKKKLFERFQRLSAKPTGGEPSYGLGLALSRDLVKLHGGDIKVKSQWGEGSEFIVELPTREPGSKQ
jgi:signal transduction histidine kinase